MPPLPKIESSSEQASDESASNISVALAYIAAGIPVFPCRALTETRPERVYDPKSPLTQHGFKEASVDEETVRDWWRRNPEALVGIPTGAKTGFFAVDVDVKEGKAGDVNLAKLEAEHGRLPPTVVVQTATGGFHYLFRHVEGMTNSTGGLPKHIDIRADGGFVIAAGSVFPDGTFYEFLDPQTPTDFIGAISDAPEWLINTIRTPKHKPRQDYMPSSANDNRPAEAAEIDELLAYIDPDCNYQEWLSVLMAVHAAIGEAGLSIADAWSARGSKYRKGDVATRWKGFTAGKGVGASTLAALARDGGADLSEIARKYRGQRDDGTPMADASSMSAFVAKELAKKKPMGAANDNAAPSEWDDLPFVYPSEWQGRAIPTRSWFVEKLIPMRTVTLLSGDGGLGKSLLALQLSVAAVLGANTMDITPSKGRVVYVGAEDEVEEFHRRIDDALAEHQAAYSDLAKDFLLLPLADRDATLAMPDKSGKMVPTSLFGALRTRIDQFQPKLVVLDTSADLFGGDEIKRTQVRQFVAMLRTIAITRNCAVVLLSHPSVSGMQSGTGTSGSTAWNNSVRSRLYLTAETGEGADPDGRILSVMKANYGQKGDAMKLRWQAGVFVLNDGSKPNPAKRIVERKAEECFVSLLSKFNRTGQHVGTATGTNYAPAKIAAHPDGKDFGKRALADAMHRLLDNGTIKIVFEGPPSRQRQRLMVSAEDYGPKGD